LPLDKVDDAVLRTLAGNVLRPAVAMAVIDGVLEHLTPRSRERDLQQIRATLQTVEREIGNLAQAIAAGGQLEPLLVELRARQERRANLLEAMAAHQSAQASRFDRKMIEQTVRRYLDRWRALLSSKQVQNGRQLLREVLAGPLRFVPEGECIASRGMLRSVRCSLAVPALHLFW
jgi:hypothetical protein